VRDRADGRGVNDKKAYPLRINAAVLDAVQRWADDELRSVNAQIEYVLRDALRKSGRLKTPPDDAGGARKK
jgi:hypothetical protein